MGVLTAIRDLVKDALEADPGLEGITVISENSGNIANLVTRELSKLGVFVVVLTPGASGSRSDTRAPYLDSIPVVIQVGQKAIMGADTPKASDIAELVLAILHHKSVPGVFESIVPDNPPIQLVTTPPPGVSALYQVRVKTAGGVTLDPAPTTVATPVINAGTITAVTMTCATAAAAIWYTTDGTRPTPTGGTLYTGAFNATGATAIKARAGRWGALASAIATAAV